jgi:hypothetical protein
LAGLRLWLGFGALFLFSGIGMSSGSITPANVPSGTEFSAGYLVIIHNRRLGPLPAAELRGVGLQGDSWAWRPGLADWQRVEQIDELRPLLYAEPPPLPTALIATTDDTGTPPSVTDFRRAMPFVAGIVLCYLLTAPLLSLLKLVGLGGGVIERLAADLPFRICCAVACYFLSRTVHLPHAWAWAIPSVLNPLIGLVETIGLAVFARRRLKAAGIPMGFFGPRT